MAQYTQRSQPMHRPGQSEHGHGGGALAYGKPAGGVVPPQPRPPPAAPYAPQPYPSQLRMHQPGYGSAPLSYRDSSYARGGGAVGEYRTSNRMSILGSSYLPAPQPAAHHPPPADPPPFKKIRISAADRSQVTPLPQHHQPLRVDTREPVNAYNTVEVLSPNPPSEPTVEDQSFRTTKDDLLQQISKVDREMALSDAQLSKLRKKQEELEQTASKPAREAEPEEAVPRHRSLAQCVYADNRKKATAAHALLSHLGPPVSYPLYNQPQDTEVYHENIRKHRTFRKRLAEHIRRLKQEAEKREDALAEAYTKRAAEWLRRVDRIEQGQKRKAKDARNREFFEKVFPELRKQREERERFNRLGARVKSEAELEEIADGLHEQEHEDKKMRSLTVVPPLLRDPKDTTPVYIDTNRRCMDMESEHKDLQLRNVWSSGEREVFRDKYLQHPKNFGQIASFLPRKSVRDCVRFYYLSKKAENYKQLLRKPRQRRSARNPPRQAPEPELPAGVTTRLQRSQGTVGRVLCPGMEGAMGKEGGEEGVVISDAITCIPVPPNAPMHPASVEMIRTPPLPPSPPPASSAPLAPSTSTSSTLISSIPAGSPGPPPAPPPSPPAPASTPTSIPTPTLMSTPTSTATSVAPSMSTAASIAETTSVTVTSADVTVTITAVTTSTPTSTAPSVSTTISIPPSISPALLTSAPTSTSPTPTSATSVSMSTLVTSVSVPTPPPALTPAPSGGSAPPTPQPAQPPTPTQPPPTPEAAVTERTATPSSTVTVTTTTVTGALSPCACLCCVCNMPGATLTVSRSHIAHLGLQVDATQPQPLRVCSGCHVRASRAAARDARCGVAACAGGRGRARRLRHLPPRWHDLPQDLKKPLMDEFQIPSDLSKCCLACFKKITRRLDTVAEGGCIPEPSEEEASRFRALLRDHGTAWDRIAALSGMTPASLKAFYFTYRKKLQLDSIVSSRTAHPASSTEESLSGDSDTASAGESPRAAPPAPHPRTDAAAPRRTRRDEYDNDSSATETADEENDAPSTAKILPPTSISIPVSVSSTTSTAPSPSPTSVPTITTTVTTITPQPPQQLQQQSPQLLQQQSPQLLQQQSPQQLQQQLPQQLPPPHRNGPATEARTVRDVVLNLIEISLTRDSNPIPPYGKPHLKVSSSRSEALATLSVVSSGHSGVGTAPRSPQRPATITALQPASTSAPAVPAGHEASKEGVMVLHIEPRPEHRQEPLLDLSVKRRHEVSSFPHPNKMYRNSTDYQTFRTQSERESPNQYNSKPKPVATPPRPALKPAATKGSITLGTPVETRFDPRRTPPEPKTGSITAGTPVHGTHHIPDKRGFDYFKRRSPGGAAYYAATTSQPRPQSPSSFSPNASNAAYSRSPYGMEQQRQIIITDFITSQQMHPPRREREYYPRRGEGAPPPPPHPPPPAPAVSVIQRHQYPHHQPHPQHHPQHHPPHAPPPGHEAFTSLVDVASAATALPVPRGEPKQEPKQQPQHIPQHHEIRTLRDVNIQQKYHPQQIQYQVLQDRRVQAQYLERDRQNIVMHQRRETERAMAAMQERHAIEQQQQQQQQQQQLQQQQQQQQQLQQQQQQQQLLHERQHHLHQQSISSEVERRAANTSTYSVAKHHVRALTPHHVERKDTRGPAPAPAAGAARGEGTLTAASLIDAIVTHQISQTSEQRFMGVQRDCDNGQPAPTERPPEREEHPPHPTHPQHPHGAPSHPAAHTASFKLGDLASNIIKRDFASPTTSNLIHNSRFSVPSSTDGYTTVSAVTSGASSGATSGASAANDDWKRRDNPKHAPFLEPVSPPDNHHNRGNSNRRYSCVSGAGGFTAFDYVTTRIVEVMRSDAEEQRTKQIAPFQTSYAFPYSALNVATPTGEGAPAPPAPAAPAPPAPPPQEPAPLMSAQYEPLSDED